MKGQVGDRGVDGVALHMLADGVGVADALGLAEIVGDDGPVGAGVVAHGHAPPAAAADDEALEQGVAFAGRAGFAVEAVGGGVGGEGGLVGLEPFPGYEARVVVVYEDGPFVDGFGQCVVFPVEVGGVAGAAVGVGAGVGWVVQHLEDLVVGQRCPVQLPGLGAAAVPAGEGQLLVAERLDGGECRAGGGECVEEQLHGLADAGVGVGDDLAAGVVD